MLRQIKVTSLSCVFLLYATGILQAHSLYVFPTADDYQPAKSVVQSTTGNKILNSSSTPAAHKVTANSAAATKTAAVVKVAAMAKTRPGKKTVKPNDTGSGVSKASKSSPATKILKNNKRQTAQRILPTDRQKKKVTTLRRLYRDRTGRGLNVTSFYRTPVGQAKAIQKNLRSFGVGYVTAIYRHSAAIREILLPYRSNRRRPQMALRGMTLVIKNQLARGIFVSNHMLGNAVDIRSRGRYGARLSVLRQVARSIGARVVVERNHYHVELT